MIRQINRIMKDALDQVVFPGAVLLCSKQKRILFHESYGYADIFSKRPITKHTIFDLASLTKPFATALIVARMINDGVLSLSDLIETHLPQFKVLSSGGITIEMLLRHTSGLPAYKEYYKVLPNRGNPRDELRKLLLKENLISIPGEKQVYSDLGFMVLSWLIEAITGKRIDRLFQEYVLSPLEIERLFFIELKNNSPQLDQEFLNQIAATQECPWREKLLHGEVDDDNTWAVCGIEGHAGLFGDALSLHRICTELLDASMGLQNDLIPPELYNQFTIKKDGFDMVAGFDTPSKVNSSAGRYFSGKSIGHLGYTGTSFWIDPEAELIVIFLTNRVHPTRQNETIKKFRPKLHDLIHSILA